MLNPKDKLKTYLSISQFAEVDNIIQDKAELSDELYDILFPFYQEDMPYGTQKARTGDPFQWITNQLKKDMQTTTVASSELLTGSQVTEVMNKFRSTMHPSLRLGQHLFNTVCDMHPALAETVRATDADPFHNNGKIGAFFKAICSEDGLNYVPKAFQK